MLTALSQLGSPSNGPGYLPLSRQMADGDVVKFCQRTDDAWEIESVIIPMGARDKTWRTLCVSSQIGCKRGCTFCQTAQMGLVRNLTVDEILGQVRAARVVFGANVRNVVFMGMGEPMDNLENVVAAITAMHEDCINQIPRRRITVSTVGRCDGIRRLAALRWRRLNLAVSLNAPNDEVRSQIMPINRIEPMALLRDAIAEYPVRAGGHVLIEYVLIRGLNDKLDHARQLAEYLRGLHTCVNLIPYNPREESPYETPDEDTVVRFQVELMSAGQLCFRRGTKGTAAMAACGQLGNLELRRARKSEVA
ncbi:MAG: 23S rRNA (adenine(2503)-C2)-methyltransferase [Planctomycetota bacterium]|nr:MAG: 23S rRNA (adenine(2503)-C2)-methyltransferase [Planctomycetota bacterium]